MINLAASAYHPLLAQVQRQKEQLLADNIPMSVELARASADAFALFALPKLEIAVISDRKVTTATHAIPVRIYHPTPAQSNTPVMVFFHGGGHVCGDIPLYDGIARRLAISTGHIVVSVGYRLAPEHPYPAGLTDCRAVTENLAELLEADGADLDQISLCGDSAGGNLAISVCYDCIKDNSMQIQNLILIYPSVDFTLSSASHNEYEEGYLLEKESVRWYFKQYFSDDQDREKASPLFFPDLSILPRTLILAAECDPIVDDGKRLWQRLIALEVPCEYELYPGLIHCYINLEKQNPNAIETTYDRISAFLKND